MGKNHAALYFEEPICRPLVGQYLFGSQNAHTIFDFFLSQDVYKRQFCGPDINADVEENWLEGVPREEWLHALFAAPPSRRFQLPWDIQRELGHELSGME